MAQQVWAGRGQGGAGPALTPGACSGPQRPQRLPVRHTHLQRFRQPGPLRPVPFLLRHQGAPAALRACPQVPHHQGRHLPLFLAGWVGLLRRGLEPRRLVHTPHPTSTTGSLGALGPRCSLATAAGSAGGWVQGKWRVPQPAGLAWRRGREHAAGRWSPAPAPTFQRTVTGWGQGEVQTGTWGVLGYLLCQGPSPEGARPL